MTSLLQSLTSLNNSEDYYFFEVIKFIMIRGYGFPEQYYLRETRFNYLT